MTRLTTILSCLLDVYNSDNNTAAFWLAINGHYVIVTDA
jgi:hypothetical protein